MLREIHTEVTDHSVSIWWDPSQKEEEVLVSFLGKQKIAVNSHVEFDDLDADTEYTFAMDDVELSFHTLPEKKRLDITKEPYLCKTNTLCTSALQKALDDCDADSTVYIPAGVYLSGALNMHSSSSLYFEKGAVLQGSEDPKDYEPRILSRFEGTERMCYRSLINLGTLDHDSGPNCANVLIYGQGEIRGGGFALA
jgi:polygalacturonase